MFYVTITSDGLDSIADDLRDLDLRAHDVRPLADEIAVVMAQSSLSARMLGVDRDGHPLQPLKESTIRRNPNRITDTPLIPMEAASRLISGFETDVIPVGYGSADVVGSWPAAEPWLIYHVTGTRHMPARNPAGMPPSGWVAVGDAFDQWMSRLAGGVET